MAKIKIVDGAIRLPDTKKNREDVAVYLRKLIEKKGLKTKTGKPSKNFKGFPQVFFDGQLTIFKNKAEANDKSVSGFNFGNKAAVDAEKNLREQDLKDANALYSDEEVAAGKKKQRDIKKSGLEADHDLEVQEFGPARRNLEYELASGRIGKRIYNKQLKILKERGIGDVSENTIARSQSENLQKKDEVLAKNKALAAMEAKNPSFRFDNNEFIQQDRFYKTAKSRRNKTLKAWKKSQENGNGNGNGNGKLNGKNGKNGKFDFGAFDTASKVRSADQWANIVANTATGNLGAAAVGGTVLGMTTALQNQSVQKAVGGQIAKLVSKRAGRTAMKAIPGLDVFLSGQETLDYLKQGKLDQAGIAALSGAIGWIPVIGDGAAASLDLSNTGLDISRLHFNSKKQKREGTIPRKTPTRRMKFKT